MPMVDVFGLFTLPGSDFIWGLVFGIFPEIIVGLLLWNRRLRRQLRAEIRADALADLEAGEWDPAVERVMSPLSQKVDTLAFQVDSLAETKAAVEDVRDEVRAFYTHFDEYREKTPKVIHGAVMSALGVEKRVSQKALAEMGEGFEGELEVLETQMALDPEVALAAAAKRVAEWQPSEEFRKTHPYLTLATEIGKPQVLALMQRWQTGGQAALPRATGGSYPSIYGR